MTPDGSGHLRVEASEARAGSTESGIPAWFFARSVDFLDAARRHPRIATGVPLLGLLVGVALALVLPARYPASAAFVPDNEAMRLPLGGLAGLASQLGVSPSRSDPPQFYADLLTNRTVLEQLLAKQFRGGARADGAQTLSEILGIRQPPTDPKGREDGIKQLNRLVVVSTNPRTNVVSFTVEMPTPQLAVAVADDLLVSIDRFNIDLRQSRASAQQRFMRARVDEAGAELAATEDSLRRFLSSNRAFQGSPALTFEEERLRRDQDLRQTLYVNLRQQLDQATIDAARNTPALTVITRPELVTTRSFPKRRLVVAVAVAASLIIALLWLRLISPSSFADKAVAAPSWSREMDRLRSIVRR